MEHLKPMPDFYGPFWVCVTLIFSIAISGNLADFFESLGADTDWEYDFKKGKVEMRTFAPIARLFYLFCYMQVLFTKGAATLLTICNVPG